LSAAAPPLCALDAAAAAAAAVETSVNSRLTTPQGARHIHSCIRVCIPLHIAFLLLTTSRVPQGVDCFIRRRNWCAVVYKGVMCMLVDRCHGR
jgi:hypothetical protein